VGQCTPTLQSEEDAPTASSGGPRRAHLDQHLLCCRACSRVPPAQVLLNSSAVKAHRCASGAKGEFSEAIGRSRGGRTTKIHALRDGAARPLAFILTGDNAADCAAREDLLERLPAARIVHADRAYDSNSIRGRSKPRAQCATSGPSSTGSGKACFLPFVYPWRNAIERMFGRASRTFLPRITPLRPPRAQLPRSHPPRSRSATCYVPTLIRRNGPGVHVRRAIAHVRRVDRIAAMAAYEHRREGGPTRPVPDDQWHALVASTPLIAPGHEEQHRGIEVENSSHRTTHTTRSRTTSMGSGGMDSRGPASGSPAT
jgi:hypothetical protein